MYLSNFKLFENNFKYLKFLNINNFSKIHNLQNLYSINISKTMITKINENTFYNLPNLNYLSISFNKHLRNIENGFLFNVQHLNLLFINYNPNLYSCFIKLDSVKELKSLYLNHNRLQKMLPTKLRARRSSRIDA